MPVSQCKEKSDATIISKYSERDGKPHQTTSKTCGPHRKKKCRSSITAWYTNAPLSNNRGQSSCGQRLGEAKKWCPGTKKVNSKAEEPVVPHESNRYGHPLAGLLWEEDWKKYFLKHNWKNAPSIEKSPFNIKMVGKRKCGTNAENCCEKKSIWRIKLLLNQVYWC